MAGKRFDIKYLATNFLCIRKEKKKISSLYRVFKNLNERKIQIILKRNLEPSFETKGKSITFAYFQLNENKTSVEFLANI